MNISYARPTRGEVYLVNKSTAQRIVRAHFADLRLLSFQTVRPPKKSEGIPYLAKFAESYIRILSVRTRFVSPDLRTQFVNRVLPYICDRAKQFHEEAYYWPLVVVALDGVIYAVTCSEGHRFPDREEIGLKIKRGGDVICTYDSIDSASATLASNQSVELTAIRCTFTSSHD